MSSPQDYIAAKEYTDDYGTIYYPTHNGTSAKDINAFLNINMDPCYTYGYSTNSIQSYYNWNYTSTKYNIKDFTDRIKNCIDAGVPLIIKLQIQGDNLDLVYNFRSYTRHYIIIYGYHYEYLDSSFTINQQSSYFDIADPWHGVGISNWLSSNNFNIDISIYTRNLSEIFSMASINMPLGLGAMILDSYALDSFRSTTFRSIVKNAMTDNHYLNPSAFQRARPIQYHVTTPPSSVQIPKGSN